MPITRRSLFLASFVGLAGLAVLPGLHAADKPAAQPAQPAPGIHGQKVNGVYQGPVEIWSTPLTREAAGNFHNGKPDGVWTFWDREGLKIAEITYRDGTFNGTVTMWNDTEAGPEARGKLKFRGSFNDGMWQGSVLTYYPDGKTRSERDYEADTLKAAYAYNPAGREFNEEYSKKIAASDEKHDNAYVDALDAFILKWVR
ncbi:MAG: toxin-antitoxin system YwqK family antitoxin [Opitutales bacterium]